MVHTTLIALHATAGIVALACGLVAVSRGRLFGGYLWSLVAMTLLLVLSIGTEWGTIGTGERVLFAAFAALAGFMVVRAARARRIRPARATRPSARYVEHVGFTLVALFDAFAVITVLNAAAPIWAVVGTGVLIAVAGHFAIEWVKAHPFRDLR